MDVHPVSPGKLKRRNSSVLGSDWMDNILKADTQVRHLPYEAAIMRLVGAILFEQNSEWTVQRAYSITLESIAPIGEDPLVSLPTLAARVSWPKPVIVGLSASYTTQRDMTGTRVRGLQSRCGAMRPHRPPGLDLNIRNQVERLWVKLKEWCALATRHKKIAVSFLGALSLAMVVD